MSDVWTYFVVDSKNESHAICQLCQKKISRGGKAHTTTNLRKHLTTQHGSTYLATRHNKRMRPTYTKSNEIVDDPDAGPSTENDPDAGPSTENEASATIADNSCSSNVIKTQPTLFEFIDKNSKFKPGDKRQNALTDAIAFMICKDHQPFSIVEREGFKAVMDRAEPRYTMPSRKHMANVVIPKLFEKTEARTKELIKASEYFAVTTDMWTSTSNDDYLSVTVHFIDKEYELKHACLEVVPFPEISHTASNIATFLADTLELWGISGKVVAVIHDNANNMSRAMEIAELPHFSCLAHTLQLVIKDGILNNRNVQNMLATSRRIVSSFKHSSKATKILRNAQIHLKLPKHRLIQDEVTRWNSTLHMLERLEEQRRALIFASPDLKLAAELTPAQWDLMSRVIAVLRIFDKATFALSSANITISEVIPIVNSIRNQLNSMASSGSGVGIQAMIKDLSYALNSRLSSVEKNYLCALATLLDPRLKGNVFSDPSCLESAKNKLLEVLEEDSPCVVSHKESSTDRPKEVHGMWSFYAKLIETNKDKHPASSDITSAQQEMNVYFQEGLLPADQNIFQYWANKNLPRLKKLALKYLCIPPATIFSERLFSTAGLICDKKRNRLDPERVRMLVFLNKNLEKKDL